MTAFSFLVAFGIVWFICFVYVVHSLHRGERSLLARARRATIDSFSVTLVKRGPE